MLSKPRLDLIEKLAAPAKSGIDEVDRLAIQAVQTRGQRGER